MRVIRGLIPIFLLVLLFSTRCSGQSDAALRTEGDTLRLIWKYHHSPIELAFRGKVRGLSENGFLLVTRSNREYGLKVLETHSFSELASFRSQSNKAFDQPIMGQLRTRDTSVVMLVSLEDPTQISDDFVDVIRSRRQRFGLMRWDIRTGETSIIDSSIRTPYKLFDFDPGGEYFYSSPSVRELEIYETATGKRIANAVSPRAQDWKIWKANFSMPGPYASIEGIHSRKENNYILVAHEDSLAVWSNTDHQLQFIISDHESRRNEVIAARLTKDDRLILVRNDSIVTLDLARKSWRAIPHLPDNWWLSSASFIGDDSIVTGRTQHTASGSELGVLLLKDGAYSILGNIPYGQHVTFASEATRRLLIGNYDNQSRLFDLTTFRFSSINLFPPSIKELLIDRSASTLLARSERAVVSIDPEQLTPNLETYTNQNPIAISNDHKLAAIGGSTSATKLWDLESHREIGDIRHAYGVASVAFSPAERSIAILTGHRNETTVSVYDITLGTLLRQQVIPSATLLRYTKDGNVLLAAVKDSIYLLDAQSLNRTAVLAGHLHDIISMHVSADGTYICSQDWAGRITIWEWKSGILRGWYRKWPLGAAMTPNNRYLIAADDQNLIAIDLIEDKEQKVLPIRSITTFAISEDGKRIAIGSGDNDVSYYQTPESWYTPEEQKNERQYARLRFFIPRDSPTALDTNKKPYSPARTYAKLEVLDSNRNVITKLLESTLHTGKTHEWDLDVTAWAKGKYYRRITIGDRVEEEVFVVK